MNQDQNPNFQELPNDQNMPQQAEFNQAPDPFCQEYQAPVYANEFKPIKRTLNPALIIIPIVILIAAAAVFLLLFFNQPNYKKAEEKYFGEIMEKALAYSEEGDYEDNYAPRSVTVSVQTSLDRITSAIDISNIEFKTDSAVSGNNIYSLTEIRAGDTELSLEAWIDDVQKTAYLYFPGISEIYGKIDFSYLLSEIALREEEERMDDVDYSEIVRVMGDVFSKTSDTYFELIGDADVIKKQDFIVGGKTYNADKTVIHIGSQEFAKLFKAFYTNLLENEEAVQLLCDMYGFEDPSELRSALDTDIVLEELDTVINGEKSSSAAFDMTVYMSSNNIIGREIVITNDDSEQTAISVYNIPTDNGNTVYFKLNSPDPSYPVVSFLVEDEVNGELHSGKAVLTADTSEYTLEYKDFAVTDTLFQGTASLSIKDQPTFSVKLELSTEGESKKAVLTVPNICTVNVTVEPSTLEYKELPQIPDGNTAVLIGDDENADIDASLKLLADISEFINGIMGIPGFGGSDFSLFDYNDFDSYENDGFDSFNYEDFNSIFDNDGLINGDYDFGDYDFGDYNFGDYDFGDYDFGDFDLWEIA